ncbi:hypothetical protein BKA81DRAFT_424504 [Phyllosticta paracitricarpa]|uniref:Uncharacterized protein n=1 Tax=Phyllosticta citricarpa TaxID=55181 RepID=A0ABR1MAW5_9PEZI
MPRLVNSLCRETWGLKLVIASTCLTACAAHPLTYSRAGATRTHALQRLRVPAIPSAGKSETAGRQRRDIQVSARNPSETPLANQSFLPSPPSKRIRELDSSTSKNKGFGPITPRARHPGGAGGLHCVSEGFRHEYASSACDHGAGTCTGNAQRGCRNDDAESAAVRRAPELE